MAASPKQSIYTPMEHWTKAQALKAVVAWKNLLRLEAPETIDAGKKLFEEGEAARDVFLLEDGLVLLSKASRSGEESLGLRIPGQIIEQCAHHLSVPYPVSAKTILRSKIFRIPISELSQKERDSPAITKLFKNTLCIELYQAAAFIVQLKRSTPTERLQTFLKFIASVRSIATRGRYVKLTMPLVDEQIAGILGLSGRQFRRVKRQMQAEGLLRLPHPKLWVFIANPT